MASAKLTKALATSNIVLQKAPRVSGEVALTFRPLYNKTTGKTEQPKSVTIDTKPIDPLKRSDVTLDHIKNSNLDQLVRRRLVVLVGV